jgi:hypothetical protein
MSLNYTYIGQITIDTWLGPKIYDVYGSGDLAHSWERTRLQYFPDYNGPPPNLLDEAIARLAGYQEQQIL